ncbi:M28 family peptidase [Flavobacteriaceae bacterium TK19130]|nr:M28 family peptidase [Thermobacterium salinum]
MKSFYSLLFLFIAITGLAQTDREKTAATVDQHDIRAHIGFLSDDLLKGRETGTEGNKIAAAYIASILKSYGVQPNPKTGNYYQEVPLEKSTPPNRMTLVVNGSEYKEKVAVMPQNFSYGGNGVYLGYGLEDDYKNADVNEKLVFIKAGSPKSDNIQEAFGLRDKKMELAMKAGAAGVIELVKAGDRTWGYLSNRFGATQIQLANTEEGAKKLPYLWIRDEFGTYANDLSSKKAITVKCSVSGATSETILSQNVVGIVEGSDATLKNEYVIYSGHYDHVGIGEADATGDTIYNGARDNAVGVTTVLSMAENLSKYPTKRSALFILFTAEEKGLLGSKHYVENPIVPLEQMVYCFNSDNGGYNDTTKATIVGLTRTTAEKALKDAVSSFGLTAIEDPAPEQGLFDRSDNVHFARKGIPAPTFSLGFTAFDAEIMKYYHQAGDEADSLDYDYLLKFFQSYVMSGRAIGNMSKKPFWVKGDKYEESGKELYGM